MDWCNRCGKKVKTHESEMCWYCLGILCPECWDEYGHCEHPEADKINEYAQRQHIRVELEPGMLAHVSPDIKPETLEALREMMRKAAEQFGGK